MDATCRRREEGRVGGDEEGGDGEGGGDGREEVGGGRSRGR